MQVLINGRSNRRNSTVGHRHLDAAYSDAIERREERLANEKATKIRPITLAKVKFQEDAKCTF